METQAQYEARRGKVKQNKWSTADARAFLAKQGDPHLKGRNINFSERIHGKRGGGRRAGARGAGAGSGARAPRSTSGERDPMLQRQAERVEEHLDPEKYRESVGRSIDVVGGRMRDLGAGQQRALRGQLSRLGTLGKSSAEEMGIRDIQEGVRGKIAGAATDISLGRERDYDNLLLGSTGALGAPGQSAMDAARLAQSSQAQADATALQREQLRIQREMAEAEQKRAEMDDWMTQLDWAMSLA